MGKNGLFVACSGYPSCTFTQNIPDPEEDAVDVSEIEKTTCDECGAPMKVRQSRTGSTFLGCTAYPEVPQRRQRRGRGRQGRGAARRADRGDVPALRPRPRAAPRPLRRVRVLLELPGVQVQAAQADQGHGRAVSQGRRHHRRAARPLPARSTAASTIPTATSRSRCGRSRRRARSAATRTCCFRERKSGNVFACDKAGCGFEKPPGVIPPIVEIIPEVPLEPEPVPAKEPGEGEGARRDEGEAARRRRRPRPNRRAAAPRRRSSAPREGALGEVLAAGRRGSLRPRVFPGVRAHHARGVRPARRAGGGVSGGSARVADGGGSRRGLALGLLPGSRRRASSRPARSGSSFRRSPSWPSSRFPTRGWTSRRRASQAGLVDNKVAAFSSRLTAIRFVIPVARRRAAR